MARQLLIERDSGISMPYEEANTKTLKESEHIPRCSLSITDDGRYLVNALLQRAEVENKNGRIYPKNLLEREVKNYMTQIMMGNSVGECDHPEESVVSMKDNPHRIVKLWWDGNNLFGTLELLVSRKFKQDGTICCTADRLASYIMDYGMNIGISSRGVGSLTNRGGKNIVDDDFELICWDIVQAPSTHNAYLYESKPLSHESKEVGKPMLSESKKIRKSYSCLL